MTLREKLGYIILLRHIEDSSWEPSEDDPHVGTGYFMIDHHWYNFVAILSGCKPEKLLKKGLNNAERRKS